MDVKYKNECGQLNDPALKHLVSLQCNNIPKRIFPILSQLYIAIEKKFYS